MAPMRERGIETQNRILEYIKHEVQNRSYPPSVREICDAVNIKSTSTVHGHLVELEKRGLIRRDPTKPRAMEVLDGSLAARGRTIPVVGRIRAGEPILAEENIEEYIVIPQDVAGLDDTVYALEVRGDSMIDAAIVEGDYIIIRQQPVAENGEIAVVMVNEEDATIKRFFKENNGFRLQPANDRMEPLYVPDAIVVGKAVGLFRRL